MHRGREQEGGSGVVGRPVTAGPCAVHCGVCARTCEASLPHTVQRVLVRYVQTRESAMQGSCKELSSIPIHCYTVSTSPCTVNAPVINTV